MLRYIPYGAAKENYASVNLIKRANHYRLYILRGKFIHNYIVFQVSNMFYV